MNNKERYSLLKEFEIIEKEEENLNLSVEKKIERNSNTNIIINNNNIDNSKNDNNKENIINKNNLYISIDSSNYFTKQNIENIEDINNTLKLEYKNAELEKQYHEISHKIIVNLFEIIFPDKLASNFDKSIKISKKMQKHKLIKNELLEKNIEYFYNKRTHFKYTNKIKLDKTFINNCGPILCYIYKHLERYKLKDSESFENAINEFKKKKIDILNIFFMYCNQKKKIPDKVKKHEFFKSIRKDYNLHPELILLLNMFNSITKIEIEFDFEEQLFKKDEYFLFIIFILNINYIINDLKIIKLNLINKNIQYGIYGISQIKLLNESKDNIYFKKNNIILNRHKYDEKWNFEHNFILDDYKLIQDYKIQKSLYNSDNINFVLNDINNDFNITRSSSEKNRSYKDKSIEVDPSNDSSFEESDKNEKRNTFIFNSSNYILSDNNNYTDPESLLENYKYIVNMSSGNFEIIILSLFSLNTYSKLENIEIILNKNYYNEINNYIRNRCQVQIENYHILDIINTKLTYMKCLNFEINSFDLMTFSKILKVIYNNNNLSSLKISFFSSDCTYSPESLYRIYNQNIDTKYMESDIINNKGLDFRIEDKFYKEIYPHFVKNLNYFFELIKNKKLKTFGLNLDIPPAIVNDEKYIIVIIKFILNILLLYIDNNKSYIQELIILSSNLVINGHKLLFFEKLLENINDNKSILNLSIQMKFYNITSIHKLISEKLQILKIGDFDIFTLKYFTNNITKYKFCKNSNLKEISISINRTINYMNIELKSILLKLFNIKIKNLSSINLYTNFELYNKKDFKGIVTIIEDNWISSYIITFNKDSEYIINENINLIENIKYFIQNNSKIIENNNKNNIKINKIDKNEIIYLILNIIFGSKFGNVFLDFYNKKKIISKILKFLFLTNKPTISFNLEKNKQL